MVKSKLNLNLVNTILLLVILVLVVLPCFKSKENFYNESRLQRLLNHNDIPEDIKDLLRR